MRQGITTRYLAPTNSRDGRIKATARKAQPQHGWAEMSATISYESGWSTDRNHTRAAQALATKLGWSGLWIAGGKPEEDGNMYVNVGVSTSDGWDNLQRIWALGKEGEDWFYVAPQGDA